MILSIFVVYAQVSHFDFIAYDDDLYVYKNTHVQQGLTADSLRWAMTAVVSANWMPVTLLSHIVDWQLFGSQSGMDHLVNAAFHALASILLFLWLHRATRARWATAFAAFAFALHPLHVSSVAWIAERKDVLSACFFFLAIYWYVRYAENPNMARYCAVAITFAIGLLAKPMLVTFPFVLLLLDVWPLRRVAWPKMVLEKIPLFILSALASAVTYAVQKSAGAVHAVPIGLRIENALASYVTYLGQTFWPVRLTVLYPFPKAIPLWEPAIALLVLLAISSFAIAGWRTRPYLIVGWCWFLGTLIPVIGLVQVGDQSHADRYMYIPMVGLSIMLAWGGLELVERRRHLTQVLITAAVVSCALCLADSSLQATYWQNSETLFDRAIEVTKDNWIAERNLGGYLMDKPGRMPEAIEHLEASLRVNPADADSHNNLGVCFLETGRVEEAARQFRDVIRLNPSLAEAHFNLALALSKIPDKSEDAVAEYQAALRLNPRHAVAQQSLGLLLTKLGRNEEAASHLEAAERINPDYSAEYNLGVVLLKIPGREADAITHLEAAQRLHPDPEVQQTLDRLRATHKK